MLIGISESINKAHLLESPSLAKDLWENIRYYIHNKVILYNERHNIHYIIKDFYSCTEFDKQHQVIFRLIIDIIDKVDKDTLNNIIEDFNDSEINLLLNKWGEKSGREISVPLLE